MPETRSARHSIRFMPEPFATYKQTVARKAPETYALLGGDLNEPFCITELRYCPPQRLANGSYDASASHLNIDHEYMNFVIDQEWRPNGKDILGILHSHPGNYTQLSRGDERSNTGDIVFFSSCLDNDDSPNRNWEYFLAPITTFRPDGSDRITGWVLNRGSAQPLRCDVIVEGGAEMPPASPPLTLSDLRVEITRDLLVRYTAHVAAHCQDPHIEHQLRQAKLEELTRLTDEQLRQCVPSRYLVSLVINPDEPQSC